MRWQQFGFYPNCNEKSLEDFKQGSDLISFPPPPRSFCRGRVVRGQVWKPNNQLQGSCFSPNEKSRCSDPGSGHERL